MQNKYPDPVLHVLINETFNLKKPNSTNKEQGTNISESDYKISYSLIKPNVDIFKATAKELSDQYGVEMPIVNAVYSTIYQGVDIKDAVIALFSRKPKCE